MADIQVSQVQDIQKRLEAALIDIEKEVENLKQPRCIGRCNIELGDVNRHNIMQLKLLNTHVFPVSYNEKFYQDILNSGDLAKLAYFNDIIVGGVCCRIENLNMEKRLYIMTLGTLTPYRRYGIGTMFLNYVFSICKKDSLIKSVFLHVQINNDNALNFYKNFGFSIIGTAEQYYKKIEPSAAYILEKKL